MQHRSAKFAQIIHEIPGGENSKISDRMEHTPFNSLRLAARFNQKETQLPVSPHTPVKFKLNTKILGQY
jgi:hypothetical protein